MRIGQGRSAQGFKIGFKKARSRSRDPMRQSCGDAVVCSKYAQCRSSLAHGYQPNLEQCENSAIALQHQRNRQEMQCGKQECEWLHQKPVIICYSSIKKNSIVSFPNGGSRINLSCQCNHHRTIGEKCCELK